MAVLNQQQWNAIGKIIHTTDNDRDYPYVEFVDAHLNHTILQFQSHTQQSYILQWNGYEIVIYRHTDVSTHWMRVLRDLYNVRILKK